MKRLLIPLVLLSALLALGAGAWLASSTLPMSTAPSTRLTTLPPEPIVDSDLYLAVAETSDFTPPIGGLSNPQPKTAGERRLMTATSTDGLHFTSTGKILTDQGNVPDLVTEPDGTLRVYYIGQTIDPKEQESTVMAESKDDGKTWEFHTLTFTNLPQPRDPSDPDVVILDDGTYRMYYTSQISKDKIGIMYADSPDGIAFTYGGLSLEGAESVIDSTTMLVDNVWHMLVLKMNMPGQLRATSTDGKSFTFVDQDVISIPDESYFLSNPLPGSSPLRMFGFSFPQKNIRTFTTTDMSTWTTDDVALNADAATTLGSMYLQDNSVAQLNDGTYLMVYVSGLPAEE